jgi:UDP-3-O-[3-hydroxymyristoyl] N-acetylglucosamine deacetylase
LENVRGTPRTTVLHKDGVSVHLVEHCLSALYALRVDNLLIRLHGPEMPIGDGSALPFIEAIDRAGVALLDAPRIVRAVTAPIHWAHETMQLIALPASELRVSYTLHYPHSPYLRSQFYSCEITPLIYREQIAPCRTFSLYEEAQALMSQGLLKGGALDRGVLIQGDRVVNPEGVRFPDEMVRHKILDLIGDLSLLAFPLHAHIIAIRTGHAGNIQLAKLIANDLQRESCA